MNARTTARRRLAALAALAAALLTIPVYAANAAPRETGASAGKPSDDWTLMVYAIADTHNVADQMVRNFATLTRLPAMKNVNVVVEIDLPEKSAPDYPTSTLPGIAPFTTTKLIVLNGGKYDEIRDLGEQAMGRPNVLASFIAEAADRFPAKKYGLVLFDHGGAYQGGYVDEGPPGQTSLTIGQMRDGINAGLQQAGIDKLDLLDHAACLMSNYEVATGLAGLADVMVGSEESMFGDNLITPEAIQVLAGNGTGKQFAQATNKAYGTWAQTKAPELAPFTAMSAVDSAGMKTLNAALSSFAKAADKHMDVVAPEVTKARAQTLQFVGGLDAAIGETDSQADLWALYDLGDFMAHLTGLPADVEVARKSVLAALKNTVFDKVDGAATKQASGLSVYLPSDASDMQTYLSFAGTTAWGQFLTSYLIAKGTGGSGDGKAQFTPPTAQLVSQDATGVKIQGQLGSGQENNVADQWMQVQTPVEGKQTLAVVLPAYLNAGAAGRVQGVWDQSVTVIASGSTVIPATTVYQAQAGGLIGDLEAKYDAPSGESTDVRIRLLLDSAGQVQSVTATSDDPSSAAGVEIQNGGKLTPYVYVAGGNGSYSRTLAGRSVTVDQNLQVGYTKLAAGKPFKATLVVQDLAGNLSGASYQGKVG